ncbi:MAG: HPr family phosphocarrier protein [Desulfobacteraceae bacterium]|nr:MAG: HPr family phosphocarrier protein [Desulfobacteraceae bacterium]
MAFISKQVRIVNDLGVHARAAGMISKAAQNASAGVRMIKDGLAVDASSLLDILTLECAKDSTVSIEIEDPKDLEILERIEKMIAGGFGEAS